MQIYAIYFKYFMMFAPEIQEEVNNQKSMATKRTIAEEFHNKFTKFYEEDLIIYLVILNLS